ncbi:MAG: GreA/GreB family elongation factor [Bacteroidota bacterium]
MSRGFVKEGDQEEPVVIPPRAALPNNELNYVTPTGLAALKTEEKNLESERNQITIENDKERRRAFQLIDGKLNLLRQRIQSAQVIDLKKQPQNEVRFGAKVSLKIDGNPQKFQLVGVDEADVKKNKIAFTAPIAKAINGKKETDKIDFKLGSATRKIEILKIEYPVE